MSDNLQDVVFDDEPARLHNGCMAQFTIRISDELRDRIKTAAEQDKRSMNGEIEWLLDAMLTARTKDAK